MDLDSCLVSSHGTVKSYSVYRRKFILFRRLTDERERSICLRRVTPEGRERSKLDGADRSSRGWSRLQSSAPAPVSNPVSVGGSDMRGLRRSVAVLFAIGLITALVGGSASGPRNPVVGVTLERSLLAARAAPFGEELAGGYRGCAVHAGGEEPDRAAGAERSAHRGRAGEREPAVPRRHERHM